MSIRVIPGSVTGGARAASAADGHGDDEREGEAVHPPLHPLMPQLLAREDVRSERGRRGADERVEQAGD